MSAFLLGLGLLIALGLILNMAVRADPAAVSKALRYGGAIVAGLIGLGFAFTGRIGFAVPLFVFAYWLLGRPFSHLSGISGLGAGLGGLGGNAKTSGQKSQIETAFLSMQLDHDSGELTGIVSAGQFSGLDLAVLSLDDLILLREEASSDADSVRLLETYLDRVKGPDWREEAARRSGSAQGDFSGPMTRAQAYEVLGLDLGAGPDEIRTAYKALMQKLHPDHGGSTRLAAEVNAAKDFLLGE